MAGESSIEWTDATWNPVRGCSRVSPGCVNCYAEGIAARFSGPGLPYQGLAKRVGGEPRWTGKVRVIEEALDAPLRWKKPRRIFVNSMSDLFHEGLDANDVARVFAVMARAPQHTFQVLTKRSARMEELVSDESFWRLVEFHCADQMNGIEVGIRWPLPNVWLGVSVEDQQRANERIPHLLSTPAAVRFLSCEPLLGPVNLNQWLLSEHGRRLIGARPGLSWVIVGGESGRGGRPFDLAWARDLRDQCATAGVPVFVKQLGTVPMLSEQQWRTGMGDGLNAHNRNKVPVGYVPVWLPDAKGGQMEGWPADLRVRQFPEVSHV